MCMNMKSKVQVRLLYILSLPVTMLCTVFGLPSIKSRGEKRRDRLSEPSWLDLILENLSLLQAQSASEEVPSTPNRRTLFSS